MLLQQMSRAQRQEALRKVAAWLAQGSQGANYDVVPVKVLIGTAWYYGATYRTQTDGGQTRRLYLLGQLPRGGEEFGTRHYLVESVTRFTQVTWYVACYMEADLEEYAEHHPFGANFVLITHHPACNPREQFNRRRSPKKPIAISILPYNADGSTL